MFQGNWDYALEYYNGLYKIVGKQTESNYYAKFHDVVHNVKNSGQLGFIQFLRVIS
jgi:hypothetical protein